MFQCFHCNCNFALRQQTALNKRNCSSKCPIVHTKHNLQIKPAAIMLVSRGGVYFYVLMSRLLLNTMCSFYHCICHCQHRALCSIWLTLQTYCDKSTACEGFYPMALSTYTQNTQATHTDSHSDLYCHPVSTSYNHHSCPLTLINL